MPRAVCINPESLQTIALQAFILTANLIKSLLLDKSNAPSTLVEISLHIAISSLPPNKATL